jgi:transcriptional regulator with XRE-family HTH domain
MAYWRERYSETELAALAQIGGAIRVARLRIPWSQHALARRCGLSQSSISRLEAGKAPTVRVARLARVLVVLEARLVIELIPPPLPPRGGNWRRPSLMRPVGITSTPRERAGENERDVSRRYIA